ncbi:MAG: S8 family serine peptidase [Bacteroidetes bacterium]|nr:S8 family serine peptidase [Bacteroidota bacterium]
MQFAENALARTGSGGSLLSDTAVQAAVEHMGITAVEPLMRTKEFAKGESLLANTVLLTPSAQTMRDPSALEEAVAELSTLPGVTAVWRERLFRLHAVPNDSAWSDQWGAQRVGMARAWDVTRGTTDIVIGVIDTGIDFDHEDLRTQHWINAEEDANGDGLFQPWPKDEFRNGISGDLDGVDNDGNGFVDDVVGYDFVDQPQVSNAAGGDYFEPDPVPYDEMGHGSSVSGIIAAATDNIVGIAGVAPGCRIMTLRAFDARGVGAESDVARALAYAVAQGVRVVNMSFGDVVYSRVLRDVIRYAYARGVVLVASAGNSQSSELHYPSAYDETISVSATASNDILAGFSNYGQSIDLAAPGSDILTTDTEGRYRRFYGTSAAAPFVAGAAALVLSRHPTFSPEEVRGILLASAEDLGSQGWDDRYGAGLLRVDRATLLDNPSVVRITAPRTDLATNAEQITIVGTAASPVMRGYRLQYGVGVNPTRWRDLTGFVNAQAVAETLAVWDIVALPDTTYTLRLAAESSRGVSLDDRIVFHIDRTPPRILGAALVPAVEGASYGIAVGFLTDEPTLGTVWYREQNSSEPWLWVSAEGETENNLFVGSSHHVYMGPAYFQPGRTYEFYLSAENAVGLETIARESDGSNFFITIPAPVNTFGYVLKPWGLPLSRLSRLVTDLNGNSRPELLANNLEDDNAFNAWEFNGNGFFRVDKGEQEKEFPRGAGDLDGDGIPELLTSFVRNGFLYRGRPAGFPSERIWVDTVDGDFWSVDIHDVDGDGRQEVLAVIDDSTFGIFQWDGATLQEKARLVNPTGVDNAPRNVFSAPRAAFGDFNNNGRPEILLGDGDGDFFIAEYAASGEWEFIWGTENDFTLGSDFVASGDFNADGRDEFVLGFRTLQDDVVPFWYFGIFRLDSKNELEPLWNMQFSGVVESAQHGSFTRIQNSITVGNLDDDPADELVITTFPELYVVEYDATTREYGLTWHYPLVNTDAVVIADFDGNGIPELAFATPDSVMFFERDLPYTGPEPPRSITVSYEHASTVRLSWTTGTPSGEYRIYRGIDGGALEEFGSFPVPIGLSDPSLEAGRAYVYAVSAVDTTRTPSESPKVFSRTLRPHPTPVVDSITDAREGQLRVSVSQEMGTKIPSPRHFLLNGQREPESVALLDPRTLLLSFGTLDDGQYGVTLSGLRDGEGIPFADRTYGPVDVRTIVPNECYIERVDFFPPREFDVWFSASVEAESAGLAGNYTFLPAGTVVEAVPDAEERRKVRIRISDDTPIGALGKEYVLKVRNIRCEGGTVIGDGPGSTAGVILNRRTLEDVFVYPNPLKPEHGQQFVTFANLTPRATIRIYTLSGLFVAEVEEHDGNGGTEWDIRDTDGNLIPAGVYVYRATGTDTDGHEVDPVLGKFAIIR